MDSRAWMIAASVILLAGAVLAQALQPQNRPDEARDGAGTSTGGSSMSMPAGSAQADLMTPGGSSPATNSEVPGNDEARSDAVPMRHVGQGRTGHPQRDAGQSPIVAPVVMLLVPNELQQQSEQALAEGCWAKLYGRRNLQGDSLMLLGPLEMRRMKGPFDVSWGEKLHSIQAGPRATVTFFDNEDFRDRQISVQSGKHLSDLRMRARPIAQVSSIRIDCDQAHGGRS